MTIAFQSFRTHKKTSSPLILLVWNSPLTLSSLSYLLSPLLRRKPPNPGSPDETTISLSRSTNNPKTVLPDAASSPSTGLQFSISLPENDQSKPTDELLPFISFLSDVRPFLSMPNHLKLQPDHFALGRQHRSENYTNQASRTKRHRFNQDLQYCLKPEFCKEEIIF